MMARAATAPVEVSEEADLVSEYATLVKRIARHTMTRLPSSVQMDDLVQAGLIGLMEAIRQYDPDQGASFETYATIRVRGAMLDELRRGDWSPRSVSKHARQLAEANRSLEHQKGRSAAPQEVAEHLGLSLNEYHQWVLEANNQSFFSLDQLGVIDAGATPDPDNTYRRVEDEQRRSFLSRSINTLSEREQLVLSLYYDKDMNLKEIGDVLGVSESRVCQIHGEATVRLRSRMGSWR